VAVTGGGGSGSSGSGSGGVLAPVFCTRELSFLLRANTF